MDKKKISRKRPVPDSTIPPDAEHTRFQFFTNLSELHAPSLIVTAAMMANQLNLFDDDTKALHERILSVVQTFIANLASSSVNPKFLHYTALLVVARICAEAGVEGKRLFTRYFAESYTDQTNQFAYLIEISKYTILKNIDTNTKLITIVNQAHRMFNKALDYDFIFMAEKHADTVYSFQKFHGFVDADRSKMSSFKKPAHQTVVLNFVSSISKSPGVGESLFAAFMYSLMNQHVGTNGLLELAESYKNAAGLCLYSKYGWEVISNIGPASNHKQLFSEEAFDVSNLFMVFDPEQHRGYSASTVLDIYHKKVAPQPHPFQSICTLFRNASANDKETNQRLFLWCYFKDMEDVVKKKLVGYASMKEFQNVHYSFVARSLAGQMDLSAVKLFGTSVLEKVLSLLETWSRILEDRNWSREMYNRIFCDGSTEDNCMLMSKDQFFAKDIIDLWFKLFLSRSKSSDFMEAEYAIYITKLKLHQQRNDQASIINAIRSFLDTISPVQPTEQVDGTTTAPTISIQFELPLNTRLPFSIPLWVPAQLIKDNAHQKKAEDRIPTHESIITLMKTIRTGNTSSSAITTGGAAASRRHYSKRKRSITKKLQQSRKAMKRKLSHKIKQVLFKDVRFRS